MPGHFHDIYPHEQADLFAKKARKMRRAYAPYNFWRFHMLSPTMRWLKRDLDRAAEKAARSWPKLRVRLRGPRPIPAAARWHGALHCRMDDLLPSSQFGKWRMPTCWSDIFLATRDPDNCIPLVRTKRHVYINDGKSPFNVVMDDPDERPRAEARAAPTVPAVKAMARVQRLARRQGPKLLEYKVDK